MASLPFGVMSTLYRLSPIDMSYFVYVTFLPLHVEHGDLVRRELRDPARLRGCAVRSIT